jgi:hypothetical protein
MTRNRQPGFSGWLRRIQALCCLLPLLIGQTEVLPGLFAVAAAVEGSHTTYAGATPQGFRLVLSHERGQVGRVDFLAGHQPVNRLHRHGLAAKVICTLAGSTQKLADHEACFSSGGAAQQSKRELRPALQEDLAISPILFISSAGIITAASRTDSQPSYDERIAVPDTVQALRTTVLLL